MPFHRRRRRGDKDFACDWFFLRGKGVVPFRYRMILSYLYRLSPDECKFIMIDPKMLELLPADSQAPHLRRRQELDAHSALVK